jgi:hypothetical protein
VSANEPCVLMVDARVLVSPPFPILYGAPNCTLQARLTLHGHPPKRQTARPACSSRASLFDFAWAFLFYWGVTRLGGSRFRYSVQTKTLTGRWLQMLSSGRWRCHGRAAAVRPIATTCAPKP